MLTPAQVQPKLLTLAISQVLMLGVTTAHAATITVTSSLDDGTDCTLREAIANANDNTDGDLDNGCAVGSPSAFDEIVFDASLSASVITLSSTLSPTSAMRIDGDIDEDNAPDITISGNNSYSVLYVTGAPSQLALNGLTITEGYGHGAAVNIESAASVSISNSVLTVNDAGLNGYGGAIQVKNASLTLSDSELSGNDAEYGGAVFAYGTGATVSISGSSITSNDGAFGGAIRMDDHAYVSVSGSSISGNSAFSTGGAIHGSNYSTLAISNSTISGNTATNNPGGAINLSGNSNVTIEDSTLSGNSANNGSGGALRLNNSTITMTNSTVSGNYAKFSGGGIMLQTGTASIYNSTISGNATGDVGGGFYAAGVASYAYVYNSIIANSIGGDDCDDLDTGATITASASNIIESDACGTYATNVDPNLGDLADNGGDTLTHLPLSGSPAIDGGNADDCTTYAITTDQRGEARDASCDVGSVEVQASSGGGSSSSGGGAMWLTPLLGLLRLRTFRR